MEKVVLSNFSWTYDKSVFLPLPIATLAEAARQDAKVTAHYEIDLDFFFLRDDPDKIAAEMLARDPVIVGFSIYIWNEQLSLAVAQRVKAAKPEVLIIFGGSSISQWPEVNEKFLRDNPQVDIAVRGEGETTFCEILRRRAGADPLAVGLIAGTSYLEDGKFVFAPERKRERDLSVFPSPFLNGTFDVVMAKHPEIEWQGLWESNRGCCYECTFCSWSAVALGAKLGVFPEDRLKAEMQWFADKKIGHVYCCDANWAILPRDAGLTDALVATKKARGYPKSFFVNTMKNATVKTFETAKKLFEAGMSKSLILSMQSMDEDTLVNIKRGNIKLEHYTKLQKMAQEIGMPTCSELILALPGETYESFCRGIETEIDVRQFTIFMYWSVLLPGSEMAKPDYMKQHGIQTTRVTIASNHADLAENERSVPEIEDVVTATSTMPYKDWLKCNETAWFVYSFMCMGLATFPLLWLKHEFGPKFGIMITHFGDQWINPLSQTSMGDRFPIIAAEVERMEKYYRSVQTGVPTVPRDGIEDSLPIRWPIEEATFLAVSKRLVGFYAELEILLREYVEIFAKAVDPALLNEILDYQYARLVRWDGPPRKIWTFSWNLPEYFDRLMKLDPVPLEKRPQIMTIADARTFTDPKDFSKRGVWFARRGGKFFYDVTWTDAAPDVGA